MNTEVELNIDFKDKLGRPNRMKSIYLVKGRKNLAMVKTDKTVECLDVMEDEPIEKIYKKFKEKFAY